MDDQQLNCIFQHLRQKIESHHKSTISFGDAEYRHTLSALPKAYKDEIRAEFKAEIDKWARELLENAWSVCRGQRAALSQILLLNITSTNQCSAHTLSVLFALGPVNGSLVYSSLKGVPAIPKPIQQQQLIHKTIANHAFRNQLRGNWEVDLDVGPPGVVVTATDLLTPRVVGGAIRPILRSKYLRAAASKFVTNQLRQSILQTLHTKQIQDMNIVPISNWPEVENLSSPNECPRKCSTEHSLAVRLCVGGWVSDKDDLIVPWRAFDGGDTFALQWEVEALQELSKALTSITTAFDTLKSSKSADIQADDVLRGLSHTFPLIFNNLNPWAWTNSMALAIKSGAILGKLLCKGVFGNRPVTLIGYSLGSLVIYHALLYLLAAQTPFVNHLIQDVYIFGSPIPIDLSHWSSIRRMVAGKFVNGYSSNDLVLAVLCRLSEAKWDFAGLKEIEVAGIQNVLCTNVEGHMQWKSKLQDILRDEGAVPSVRSARVLAKL